MTQPARWVDSDQTLHSTIDALKKSRHIGVDTESNSLYAYQEQVCLIQFTNESDDFLVDPLAAIEVAQMGGVFADKSIEKIFHAAEYDVICLKRDFAFEFNHLFDTMQAARILGMQKLGLSSLLEEFFGVDQGKSYQKANWGKRPLPEKMRYYARLDTHFLLELRGILARQLSEKNLMELAKEDFQRLCLVQPSSDQTPLYTQIKGYHLLSPDTLAVLDALCRFRDREAKKKDRPHFKVLGNKALLAIAEEAPKTTRELYDIQSLSPRIAKRYERELLNAVKKGRSNPPIHLEKRRRPSQAYIDRLQALQDWRKHQGKQMGVPSDIVLPRDIMEETAANNPRSPDVLEEIMDEVPWRFDRFGRDMMNILRKSNKK